MEGAASGGGKLKCPAAKWPQPFCRLKYQPEVMDLDPAKSTDTNKQLGGPPTKAPTDTWVTAAAYTGGFFPRPRTADPWWVAGWSAWSEGGDSPPPAVHRGSGTTPSRRA